MAFSFPLYIYVCILMLNVYINLSNYVMIKECYHKVLCGCMCVCVFFLLPNDLVECRLYTNGEKREE